MEVFRNRNRRIKYANKHVLMCAHVHMYVSVLTYGPYRVRVFKLSLSTGSPHTITTATSTFAMRAIWLP